MQTINRVENCLTVQTGERMQSINRTVEVTVKMRDQTRVASESSSAK